VNWVLNSMLRYWRETLQVLWHAFGRENPNWSEITVDELFERLDSDPPALLIDVRSVEDFNGGYGHIPNSRLIPMLELESSIEGLSPFKDKEIVTMCPGGGLSLVAVDILTEAGFKDVKSLKGGTDMWHEKGYPTTN
jgi:rhodanese-related sulfurtransferase